VLLYDCLGEKQRSVIEVIGPKMSVTNVAEYFYHHERERWAPRDFPWPKPPFRNMWAEYKLPRTCWSREQGLNSTSGYADGFTPYFGCFVTTNRAFSPNEKSVTIREFSGNITIDECEPPPGEFGIYGGVWYVDRQNRPKRYGREVSLRFDIGEDGKISKVYSQDHIMGDPQVEENVYLFYPVLLAFSFSNCKNIEVVEVRPPAKLNKARVRRGNRPLVSYKVINVLPFGKSYAPSSRTVESAGEGVALHIRAGNFARYGDKYGRKKLFGKHEGMYWRPQAVVGTADAGVSVHEYEVKTE
jgi:hypothetical protein